LDWLGCGLPESLHLDNAQEFKSEALERGTREYGINLLYRPIGWPHYGGHIERLIGTVMGAVHLLPGTTFANVTKKGSYRPEKKASLTLLELERWLALQQHRVNRIITHGEDFPLGVARRQIWIHLFDFLGHKTELRNPIGIKLVVELYLNRRMQSFTALKSWTGNVFTAFNS
jgi:transposase InsO family protein